MLMMNVKLFAQHQLFRLIFHCRITGSFTLMRWQSLKYWISLKGCYRMGSITQPTSYMCLQFYTSISIVTNVFLQIDRIWNKRMINYPANGLWGQYGYLTFLITSPNTNKFKINISLMTTLIRILVVKIMFHISITSNCKQQLRNRYIY